MSDQPNLDDVIAPTEQSFPDHREHAKVGKHPNDEALEQRTEHEREEVHSDQHEH